MTGFLHEKEFSRTTFLKGGGALLVGFSVAGAGFGAKAAYAADDHHPVKAAADAAATARGWVQEPWYAALRRDVVPMMATVERVAGIAAEAGLVGAAAEHGQRAIPRSRAARPGCVATRYGAVRTVRRPTAAG